MSHLRRWRVAQMNRSVTFNFLLDRVDQILGSLVYLIHITYVFLNPSLVPQRSQHTIEIIAYHRYRFLQRSQHTIEIIVLHRDHGILERSQHTIESMTYHRDHGILERSQHNIEGMAWCTIEIKAYLSINTEYIIPQRSFKSHRQSF